MKKLIISILSFVMLAGLNAQTVKDIDGNTYKTVKIGNQVWLAENLNYKSSKSYCYGDNSSTCEQYGRLYSYEIAKNVCPAGWHLPNLAEFETLLANFGGKGKGAYDALKKGGSSGFNALFGGHHYGDGLGRYVGYHGYFWSSTLYAYGDKAFYMSILNADERASTYYRDLGWGFSVRCVKN